MGILHGRSGSGRRCRSLLASYGNAHLLFENPKAKRGYLARQLYVQGPLFVLQLHCDETMM